MTDVAKLSMSLDDIISSSRSARPAKADRPASKPNKPKQKQAPKQIAQAAPPTSGPRKGLKKNRKSRGGGGLDVDMQPQQQQQQSNSLRNAPPLGSGRGGGGGGGGVNVKAARRQRAPLLAIKPQIQKRSGGGGPPLGRPLRSGGGGAGGFARAPLLPPVSAPPPRMDRFESRAARMEALEGNGRWEHDKYDDVVIPRRAPSSSRSSQLSTKLIITNLHYDVTEEDLKELFGTCGQVNSAKINFDNSGRSLGSAYVVFETRKEAEIAKERYDGVELDKMPMSIKFPVEGGPEDIPTRLASGITVGRVGGSGAGRALPRSTISGPARTFQQAAQQATGGMGRPRSFSGPAPRTGRLRSAVVSRSQHDDRDGDYMDE